MVLGTFGSSAHLLEPCNPEIELRHLTHEVFDFRVCLAHLQRFYGPATQPPDPWLAGESLSLPGSLFESSSELQHGPGPAKARTPRPRMKWSTHGPHRGRSSVPLMPRTEKPHTAVKNMGAITSWYGMIDPPRCVCRHSQVNNIGHAERM